MGSLHRARIVIEHGANLSEVLTANDDEDAQSMADHYAKMVNDSFEVKSFSVKTNN